MADVRILGHTGPVSGKDGDEKPIRQGKEAQVIVDNLHGRYYERASRGHVFLLSTVVAGLAVPISTTTAPTVLLWNPTSSGKNLVLIRCTMAYVSGTSVAAAIGLSYITSAGSTLATGANISALAASTPTNALIGSGLTSVMRVSAAGTNTILATTNWFYTMFGESALIATTAMNPYGVSHDFEGLVVIPQGVAVYPNASAATGALLSQTFIWEEIEV